MRTLFYFIILLFLSISLDAQMQSNTDFTKVKVDNFSDNQIREFIKKYESQGFSIEQVGEESIRRGMPIEEWNKLRNRIIEFKSSQKKINLTSSRYVSDNDENTTRSKFILDNQKDSISLKIFGSSLFNRTEISYEPNMYLPTPEDYQIGPNDELIIDIYGLSENNFKTIVSPDGFIRIPRIGLIQVSGLAIEEAKKIISKKLQTIYTSIQSNGTMVSVTLGNIRSIKVTIVGEAFRPGTYTLPSVATAFNALIASGGPNDIGSFRSIKLIRNNKIISNIDIYDFLLTGELKNNQRLQDQDIIKIEPYDRRIELEGEVKNVGLFEAVEGETFSDLIMYAGGFTNKAYKERITVFRNTDKERSVADLSINNFSSFLLQNGDHFIVGKILNRFLNRVQIAGAVFRPGTYALESELSIKTLIQRADGVREDAFLNRAIIVREKEDKTKEIISFNVERLINGAETDIFLKKEDSIYIASLADMKEKRQVSIWGEIHKEGSYDYQENMTAKDLIFIAGGLKDRAELREIEVSRLIKDADLLKSNNKRAETFIFSIDRNLQFNKNVNEFSLEPYDQVIIRPISGFDQAKRVTVDGEIYYPGSYIITSKNERISDVIKRAGGLNQFAYPEGAFLIRNHKTSFAEKKMDKKVYAGISQNDTLVDENDFLNNEGIVGIDLMKILKNPLSKWDLILDEGDIIHVPRQLQTVQVSGEVFLPAHIRYDESMSFTDYVENAGGFSSKAIKKKAFIVYANGMASSTKSFIFFKKYPKVKPGARIYVPTKPDRKSLSTSEIIGLTTSTTSLAAILISLFNTVF